LNFCHLNHDANSTEHIATKILAFSIKALMRKKRCTAALAWQISDHEGSGYSNGRGN
jgi:hypothetical protein